jgi:hypothetical protein
MSNKIVDIAGLDRFLTNIKAYFEEIFSTKNDLNDLSLEVKTNERVTASVISDIYDKIENGIGSGANSEDLENLKNEVQENELVTSKAIADIYNTKQSVLVSGTNIKTINNNSILGSGNLDIISTDYVKYVAQSLTDEQKEQARANIGAISANDVKQAYPMVNHGTGDTTFTLTPNTLHVWDEVESLNISLGAPIQDVVNEYHFIFKTKDATTLSLPTNLKWSNNMPLVIEACKTYSISILNNLIIFAEFDSYIENAINYSCRNDGETIDIYSEYPLTSTLYLTFENGKVYTLNSGESQWEFTYSLAGTYYASISFSNNGYIEGSTIISDSTYKYTIPESFNLAVAQP